MSVQGYVLGIDFGTTNTVAVARTADGRTRQLLFDGSPLLPSAVYAEPDGRLRTGRDAVHSARLDPARFEPNPKRRIDEGTVLLGGRVFLVVELIAAVLRRIDAEWSRTIGPTRPAVVLTCPAGWGAPRREVLGAAAARAGFYNVTFAAEPVAAAGYFMNTLDHEIPVGAVVAVCDFGGGTFDVSAVTRTAAGFSVLAVDGLDDLGGVDLDDALLRHVSSTRALREDARLAKERLSRHPTADIPLPGGDVHVTREEFERLAEPMVNQGVRVTAKLAATLPRLDTVFLVGGSSRIPLVATLLFRELGRAPVVIEQPELAVAHGGALLGVASPQAVAPPVVPQRRLRRWVRPLRRVVMAAGAVAVTATLVTALIVIGIIAVVVYSVETHQGWLPDWGP